MSRWRILVVGFLISVPVLAFAIVGSWYLWRQGLAFYVWWPLAACMILGYVLAWYWQQKKQLLRPVDFEAPIHWTDRDRKAWELVEARAKTVAQMNPEQLVGLQTYVDTGRDMALELARFYHPQAQDPISSLTVPEILAVIELASHDLTELVDQYLPGGHLLTLTDWRRAKQLSEWYQTGSAVYWAISALFNPVNTGLRYVTSQLGMSKPFELLQQNLIAWFYTAYVHRLGTYLIDLNSGRLRVGVQRYRELMARTEPKGVGPPPADNVAEQVRQVTLTLMGQVKAGKSSLINAFLGEQRAQTDVLPATGEVTRYELQPKGVATRLVLLDTVGYGHTGPREDQLHATEKAAQESDLLLLVMHARNPARQADVQMLQALRSWFASRPDLKMPPVLGILTHIDLLSPAMEWAPPYNWDQPQRLKEQQIQDAWTATREQLGEYLVGIVPVCTATGKVYGIEEWLLPTLAELLDEAHAVALLRCLRAEVNTGRVRKVFQQLLQAGQQVARMVWEKQHQQAPR